MSENWDTLISNFGVWGLKYKMNNQQLTSADQLAEQDKLQRFFEFVQYDWEKCKGFDDYLKTLPPEAQNTESKREREEQRRLYYQKEIDPCFEVYTSFQNEDEKKNFLDFCKYMGTIQSLSSLRKDQGTFRKHKQILYLLFIIMLPIHKEIAFMAYVAAVVANLIQWVEDGKGSLVSFMLTDEDSQTVLNILFIFFCGKIYAALFVWTMIIWAFLNISEGGYHLLNVDQVKALKNFRNLFDWARLNRFKLVKYKQIIEIFIAVSSPFGWILAAQCAPLLPILYIQVVRVKYVTSQFTKDAFEQVDQFLGTIIPKPLMDGIKNVLRPYVLIKTKEDNEDKNDKEHIDIVKKEVDDVTNKLKTEQNDEPRVTELNSDDEPINETDRFEAYKRKMQEVGSDDLD